MAPTGEPATASMAGGQERASADEVAHLGLLAGRLLLANGADTAQVQETVTRFAAAFGYDAHLLVTYESLLLTVSAGEEFRTKAGTRVPAMNVNMCAIGAVNEVTEQAIEGKLDCAAAKAKLESIEHQKPVWNRWAVAALMALTGASLSRLFGGDWPTFAIVWVAGAIGMVLRQELGRRGFNLFFITFAAAFVSGSIGGLGVVLGWSGTPALCLVAPGMIIVPGVPLVNSIQDIIKNHMTMGIGRLGLGCTITLAIAFGLFTATVLTGARIPVEAAGLLLGVPEDALFSGLAALGYLSLFNVPARIAWGCVACGIASHTGRTLCMHWGIDIVSATLLGALAAGFLSQVFAKHFRAPAVTFAFPGVVAMVPGAFAFRATIGSIHLIQAGAAASPGLVAETLALVVTCVLMVAAIAVGIAAPISILRHSVRH